MKFDENLRNLRRENNYSQEYLAEKMSVSRQTISKWENGTAMPDLKKLTELANIFEVSMDTLLGNEYGLGESANDAQGIDNDTVDNIIAFIEADHKAILSKWKRILVFTIIIILIIAVIVTSSIVSNLNYRIDDLQNQINISNNNQHFYSDEPSSTLYSDYEVLSIKDDKPYIINVRFKYEPPSYVKNTKVYFLISQKNGKSKRVDAEMDDKGLFSADCEIDITQLNGSLYTVIDDNTNVTKEELAFSFDYTYIEILDGPVYNIDSSVNNGVESITLNNAFDEQRLALNFAGDIKSAEQIVTFNGKNLFSKEIKLTEINDDYDQTGEYSISTQNEITLELPDLSENPDANLYLYYEFKMEKGYTIRYYPIIYGSDLTYLIPCGDGTTHYEYIFTKDGSEIVLNNLYFE